MQCSKETINAEPPAISLEQEEIEFMGDVEFLGMRIEIEDSTTFAIDTIRVK